MANIEYRKGNLLDVTSGVIAHGVNCQGVMGSGVALAVRRAYPKVFDKYEQLVRATKACGQSSNLLGSVQVVPVDYDLRVANCFTQDFYGVHQRQVDYDAVARCFDYLDTGAGEINIPKIGAGLGGGDWKIIEAIIDAEFEGDVIVWEL